MYLARTLLYAGLALVMNTLWPLIALAPLLVLIQRGVIHPEERYLNAKFGHAYRQYQAQVRRWL
jgi:protein-S-isoprenylcysteine O-methyltransferase Ste14